MASNQSIKISAWISSSDDSNKDRYFSAAKQGRGFHKIETAVHRPDIDNAGSVVGGHLPRMGFGENIFLHKAGPEGSAHIWDLFRSGRRSAPLDKDSAPTENIHKAVKVRSWLTRMFHEQYPPCRPKPHHYCVARQKPPWSHRYNMLLCRFVPCALSGRGLERQSGHPS